jgi:hypothetical protein
MKEESELGWASRLACGGSWATRDRKGWLGWARREVRGLSGLTVMGLEMGGLLSRPGFGLGLVS